MIQSSFNRSDGFFGELYHAFRGRRITPKFSRQDQLFLGI